MVRFTSVTKCQFLPSGHADADFIFFLNNEKGSAAFAAFQKVGDSSPCFDHSSFFSASAAFSSLVMRNLGPFQFQSPSRCMTAGTM